MPVVNTFPLLGTMVQQRLLASGFPPHFPNPHDGDDGWVTRTLPQPVKRLAGVGRCRADVPAPSAASAEAAVLHNGWGCVRASGGVADRRAKRREPAFPPAAGNSV